MEANTAENRKKVGAIKRSAARLAAVQAVYAQDIDNLDKSSAELTLDVIAYYNDKSLFEDNDSDSGKRKLIKPDQKLLARLIEIVIAEKKLIDEIISEFLSAGWSIDKLSAVIKSILRCAVSELKFMPEVPAKVIINEYTNLARAFHNTAEIGFVNGILDKIALRIRPEDFDIRE